MMVRPSGLNSSRQEQNIGAIEMRMLRWITSGVTR